MTDRTLSATVGFSSAQLEDLGVPDWFTDDDMSEVLDRALLNDDNAALRDYIARVVEEYEENRQ